MCALVLYSGRSVDTKFFSSVIKQTLKLIVKGDYANKHMLLCVRAILDADRVSKLNTL